jgi:hypothetical protein
MRKPASMHEIAENIFASKAPAMIFFRLILVLSIIMMGVVRLRVVVRNMMNTEPYSKDIFVEYLMAEAVLQGDNPYLPLDELVRMYVGELAYYPHPSPHPPFVAILSIPLAFFPQQFDLIWLLFELLFIVLIAIVFTRWGRRKYDLLLVIFLSFLLLAWLPVQFDLEYGQLSILLLLLLAGSWNSIQRGNNFLGGILLGLSIAIKLITIPIMLYFFLKRDWRTVMSTTVSFVGFNLISAVIIGFGPVVQFYTKVTSDTFSYYRGYAFNYSSWSIGWRLFHGTGSPLSEAFSSPPLIYSPDLAAVISFLVPLIILIAGLIWACKVKEPDIAFSVMICVSVVVSPISWLDYHTMLAIPISVAIRWLVKRDYPTSGTLLLMTLLLLQFFGNERIPSFMAILGGYRITDGANGSQIPFMVSMLNWIPILEVIGLSWLLVHLSRIGSNNFPTSSESLAEPSV